MQYTIGTLTVAYVDTRFYTGWAVFNAQGERIFRAYEERDAAIRFAEHKTAGEARLAR
jgi:hypothetical protein